MPRNQPNESLLAEIAWLHYYQGYSQTEIADRLGLSKMVISRSLRRAFEAEIVSVSIKAPYARDETAQKRLGEAFPALKLTVVANDDPAGSTSKIGAAFAYEFFTQELARQRIGIGLGSTVAAFVEELTPLRTDSVSVVQLIGGLPMAGTANPFSILNDLAQKLTASGFHFPTTALVGSEAERDALLAPSRSLTNAPDLWSQLDCAVFGLGRFAVDEPRTALLDENVATAADIEELLRSPAVCELLGHCISLRGEAVRTSVSSRIATIPESTLRSIPRRVALAGGSAKGEAVLAALRSGLLTELVTDTLCAQEILRLLGTT